MTSRFAGVLFVTFAFVLIILAPLILGGGIPAFAHDWQWPVDRSQCLPYAFSGMTPWNSNGIGAAQIYPAAWLPYLVSGTLCASSGPFAGLIVYLALALFVAAVAIWTLCQALDASPIASTVAVCVYLGNPVVLNKLHAGHLHFLFSYAVLPLFVSLIVRRNAQWLLCGIVLGIASAQQQFLFFGLLVMLFASALHGGRWLWRFALPTFLVALAFTAPQWILALTTHAAALDVFRPLLHWQDAQSAPLRDALRMLGYIGNYDALLLSPAVRAMLWLLPLGALFGFALDRRPRVAWLALPAVFAVVLATGLRGPLAAPLRWLFVNSATAGVFRELYNMQALTTLAFAAAIAALLSLRFRSAFARGGQYVFGVAVIALCGAIAWQSMRGIPLLSIPPKGAVALERLSHTPGDFRYLTTPAAATMSLDGSHTGVSPFTLQLGSHPSALDPLNETPSFDSAQDDKGLLGVGAVLSVPGVRAAVNYEPRLRAIFRGPVQRMQASWAVRLVHTSGLIDALDRATTGRSIYPVQGGSAVDLYALGDTPDPRTSWARTLLWGNLPVWVYAQPGGIFTASRERNATFPERTIVVAGDASGTLHASGCTSLQRLDAHFIAFQCSGDVRFSGTPPLAIALARTKAFLEALPHVERPSTTLSPSTASTVAAVSERAWRVQLRGSFDRGSLLLLRQRYDDGWRCVGCNARHVVAGIYANGWQFRAPYSGDIELVFTPAYRYFVALTISIALFLYAAASSIRRRIAVLWEVRD